MANITDLVPVDRVEFASELSPCLALVSGVGMSEKDQRVWLNAAFKALDGIPIALLKRGCRFAMKTADHPSKIVPAIIAEIQDDWDWRRRYAPRPAPAAKADAPRHVESSGQREQIGQTMRSLVEKLQATAPTADQVLGKRP